MNPGGATAADAIGLAVRVGLRGGRQLGGDRAGDGERAIRYGRASLQGQVRGEVAVERVGGALDLDRWRARRVVQGGQRARGDGPRPGGLDGLPGAGADGAGGRRAVVGHGSSVRQGVGHSIVSTRRTSARTAATGRTRHRPGARTSTLGASVGADRQRIGDPLGGRVWSGADLGLLPYWTVAGPSAKIAPAVAALNGIVDGGRCALISIFVLGDQHRCTIS